MVLVESVAVELPRRIVSPVLIVDVLMDARGPTNLTFEIDGYELECVATESFRTAMVVPDCNKKAYNLHGNKPIQK